MHFDPAPRRRTFIVTPCSIFERKKVKTKKQTKSNLQVSLESLGIVFVMFLAMAFSCRDGKKSSTSFNPYKGQLNELLKSEMGSGAIKFKLAGTRDVVDEYAGATEAKAFTYMQEGAGVSIKVDGALANYPTAAQAEVELAVIAKKNKGTLTKKNGVQRFVTPDGNTVAWTNGSLLCIVTSDFARPATNFEESAPF